MTDLLQYFDRVSVINLARRPDRWVAFVERANAAGISGYQRFNAVDGCLSKPPEWYLSGKGAWGCLNSHVQLAQSAARDGLRNYLVFEDDVVFRDGFAENLVATMEKLQGVEWDQLYFGGMHLWKEAGSPWPFRDGVVQCRAVNKTHAFAANASFFQPLQDTALDVPAYMKHVRPNATPESARGPHIDHMLCILHGRMKHRILATNPWLCGQAAGKSDIRGTFVEEEFDDETGWYL